MHFIRRILILCVVLVTSIVAGCASQGSEQATVLYFTEVEQGTDSFQTRMIVTPQHLRIDSGIDGEDFILFDRKSPAIYSVNRSDRTVLIIEPMKISLSPPKAFEHTVKKDSDSYPDVGGKAVVHYQLSTNQALCYDVFAADGLLPNATQALREYALTLAGEQADAMKLVPKEMQSGCDLANNIFLPARHLEYGFPVRQEDMTGRIRQLTNYEQNYRADPQLFVLPEDYRRYRTRDMRDGDRPATTGVAA